MLGGSSVSLSELNESVLSSLSFFPVSLPEVKFTCYPSQGHQYLMGLQTRGRQEKARVSYTGYWQPSARGSARGGLLEPCFLHGGRPTALLVLPGADDISDLVTITVTSTSSSRSHR